MGHKDRVSTVEDAHSREKKIEKKIISNFPLLKV